MIQQNCNAVLFLGCWIAYKIWVIFLRGVRASLSTFHLGTEMHILLVIPKSHHFHRSIECFSDYSEVRNYFSRLQNSLTFYIKSNFFHFFKYLWSGPIHLLSGGFWHLNYPRHSHLQNQFLSLQLYVDRCRFFQLYRKIKTSQGNIFTAPMASGGGLTDLILRCLVFR